MEWYYILGAVSYSIFLIQFILSFIVGDFDLDVDFDNNSDFDSGSLVSFKGFIHFCMGFSGWLMLVGKITVWNIIIALIIGIIFIFILYYIYKLCMKFNSAHTIKEGVDLIGETVSVLYFLCDYACVCSINNCGITQEIVCVYESPVEIGMNYTIKQYKNGNYYI